MNVADVALSQKLAEELQYENEANAVTEPDFLKSFNAQGVWKVRCVVDVVLVRLCDR